MIKGAGYFFIALLLCPFLFSASFAQDGRPTDEDLLLYWEEGEHTVPDEPLISHFRILETIPASPFMSSVLTSVELAESLESTVMEGLVEEPGFYLQRMGEDRFRPIMRGFGYRKIKFVIDGIPLSNPGLPNPDAFFPLVDPFFMDRAEALMGAASVQYGSGAMGGVVHIVTQNREDYSKSFGYNARAAGRFTTAKTEHAGVLSGSMNAGKIFGAAAAISADNNKDLDAGGDSGLQPGSSLHSEHLTTNLDFRIRDRIIIRTQGQHGEIKHARTPLAEGTGEIKTRKRDLAAVRIHTEKLAPLLNSSEAYVAYQELVDSRVYFPTSAPSYQRKQMTFRTLLGSATAEMKVKELLNFVYGADAMHQVAKANTGMPNHPKGDGPAPVPDGAITDTLGIFGQFRISPLRWFSVRPGIRYEFYETRADLNDREIYDRNLLYENNQPSYEIRTLWPFTPNSEMILGAGRSYRFPSLSDLTGDATGPEPNKLNTDLKTESAYTIDWGYRIFQPFVKGTICTYHTFVQDPILPQFVVDERTGEQSIQMANQENGSISGVEAGIELYQGSNWNVGTAHAYAYGRFNNGDPMQGVPPYFGNAHLRWTDDTNEMFVETMVRWSAGKTRLADIEKKRFADAPSYGTFNLTLGFIISNYINLTLRGENIGDIRYRTFGSALYEPGINFKAQLDMHF